MSRTTRTAARPLVALVGLALAVGALSACGDDDDDAVTTGTDPAVDVTTTADGSTTAGAGTPDDSSGGADPAGQTRPAGDGAAGVVQVLVAVTDGTSPTRSGGLTCTDTASGDGPFADPAAAEAACAALASEEGRAALEPTPADVACTEIYGGSDVATITGTIDGTPVDATVTRTNGCEIARWDVLAAVVGEPSGAMG